MAQLVKSIDGISGVVALTVEEQRLEVIRAIRHGIREKYRSRFETETFQSRRNIVRGLIVVRPPKLGRRIELWMKRR